MSATLCWYRLPSAPEDNSLPSELRFKLQERFQISGGEIQVDELLIPYLEGLRDCNISGAKKLIDLITKYRTIILKWEF